MFFNLRSNNEQTDMSNMTESIMLDVYSYATNENME
jgi:hypothetical protein